MAWSHFTANLDGSRFITKAERDELWDAFTERVAAAGLSGTYGVSADIKSSGLLTDLVLKAGNPVRMLSVMNEIGASYVHPQYRTTVPSGTVAVGFTGSTSDAGSDTVLGVAAAALGISQATAEAIASDARTDTYLRWNLIRESLRALSHVQLARENGEQASKSGADSHWPTARDECISDTESVSTALTAEAGLLTELIGSLYEVGVSRGGAAFTIPTAFSLGYLLKGWRSSEVFGGGTLNVVNEVGATGRSFAVSGTGSNWAFDQILLSTLTATGSIALKLSIGPYTSATELDGFEPTTGDPLKIAQYQYHAFCAEVSFTHP